MKEQRNNDVYNHPQNEEEINQAPRPKTNGNKAEQKIAVNPNPRANENLTDKKDIVTNENNKASQAGSEITDGEDG